MWYWICGILNVVSLLTILIYRMKYLETRDQLKELQYSYDKLQDGVNEIRELASITKSSLLDIMAGYNQAIVFVDRSTEIVKYKRVSTNFEEVCYRSIMEKVGLDLKDSWRTLWSSDKFIKREQAKLEARKQQLLTELKNIEQDSAKLLNAASTIELDDYLNKG